MILQLFFLIVGILLIAYVLSGYNRKRRLEPKVAGIYFIGIAERVLFAIKVTKKLLWIFSVIPLPKPFKHIWVPLKWSEVVKGISKEDEKVAGTEEKKFKNVEKFETLSNEFYGLREELVPSLRIYEPVTYKFHVLSKNKHSFDLLLTLYIKVRKPMLAVERPNFKQVGQIDLETKIGPWALKKTTDDLLDTDIDNLKDPEDGIRFQVGKNKNDTVDMVTFLDKKLKPLGCIVHSSALRIIPGKDVDDYFKQGREEVEFDQKIANQKKSEELRELERQTEQNDADSRSKVLAIESVAYTQPLNDLLEKVYQGEADLAAKRPNVFVEANHESGRIGVAAIEALKAGLDKATSKNAGKQRREEEANA